MSRCEPIHLSDYEPIRKSTLEAFETKSMKLAFERLRISGAVDAEGDAHRAVGIYGCGSFGCTIALEEPSIVAKITRDETEVSVWETVRRLQVADPEIVRAFVQIENIEQVSARGSDPCWVITREATRPLFNSSNGLWASDVTNQYITEMGGMEGVSWRSDFANPFRDAEELMAELGFAIDGSARKRINNLKQGFDVLDAAELMSFKAFRACLDAGSDRDRVLRYWVNEFSNKLSQIGYGPLWDIRCGLFAYMQHDDVPWVMDLHAGNFGWRHECENEPPKSLVIYDFQGKMMP
jgi:hypothetical protein